MKKKGSQLMLLFGHYVWDTGTQASLRRLNGEETFGEDGVHTQHSFVVIHVVRYPSTSTNMALACMKCGARVWARSRRYRYVWEDRDTKEEELMAIFVALESYECERSMEFPTTAIMWLATRLMPVREDTGIMFPEHHEYPSGRYKCRQGYPWVSMLTEEEYTDGACRWLRPKGWRVYARP